MGFYYEKLKTAWGFAPGNTIYKVHKLSFYLIPCALPRPINK